jgi:hypothetical protein
MLKWTIRIVIGLVVLVILALAIVWINVDRIAKEVVQRGGTYALGVQTQVQDVSVSLLGGSLGYTDLNIANPSGFKAPHLMKSGSFKLAVDTSSLFGDTIRVSTLELDGLDFNLEQTMSGNNVSPVLQHLQSLGGGSAPADKPADKPAPAPSPKEPAPQEAQKKLAVDRVLIRNVVAHVHLPTGGGPLTISVPEIELKNVSTDEGGAAVSQVAARIMTAIVAAVVQKGQGILPADLQAMLNGDLSKTASALGAKAQQMVAQAGQQAVAQAQAQVTKAAGEVTSKATGEVQKAVGDKLKGILPGK